MMETTMTSGLTVADLSVQFPDAQPAPDGTVAGLASIDLHVADGEVVALLGPSGSGKSTLLRAIAGLLPLQSGRVRWRGEDVTALPTHQRGFVLMFQDGQLFPHRTVADNIGYALELQGVARAERSERIEALLDLVDLAGFGSRSIADLSGGEQQRVALARALAADPKALLLDEPLSALDRQLRIRLGEEVRRILLARHIPAILVTHDHDEAARIADRIVVLLGGRIAQQGTMDELRAAPSSAEVAAFLGVSGPIA